MAIFARRRLQSMLDEISPLLDVAKINDLVGRLADKRPEQAIAVEMELALLWGIHNCADLVIEPKLPNSSSRPEAFSETLLDKPAYIEVTTLSDGSLSGEDDMNRASQRISQFTNTIKKGYGNNLFFVFQEVNSWDNGIFTRNRCVSRDFELDENLKAKVSTWIENSISCTKASPLRLRNEGIDVVIQVKQERQKQGFNFSTSMPPVAYNTESNPLFKALKVKERQLSGVPSEALKVIFIADGGSRLLRLLPEKDPQNLQKSGSEIIHHALKQSPIDAVYVFSPYRQPSLYTQFTQLAWNITPFYRDNQIISDENMKKLASLLPIPRFEGYQARSLHKQGLFSPSKNCWYLGTKITTGTERKTMKISARLLQQFLAGKLSREQFEESTFSDRNLFDLWLKDGCTISNIRLESAGQDEDDDYVVFEFTKDPAACPFNGDVIKH